LPRIDRQTDVVQRGSTAEYFRQIFDFDQHGCESPELRNESPEPALRDSTTPSRSYAPRGNAPF
jgi:hypothetical protein